MLTLPAATARITRELQVAECAIDDALVAASALLQSVALAARDNPEVSPLETHASLLRANKALTGLLAVRGDTSRLHGQLREIGVNILAPEEPTCPPKGVIVEPAPLAKLA